MINSNRKRQTKLPFLPDGLDRNQVPMKRARTGDVSIQPVTAKQTQTSLNTWPRLEITKSTSITSTSSVDFATNLPDIPTILDEDELPSDHESLNAELELNELALSTGHAASDRHLICDKVTLAFDELENNLRRTLGSEWNEIKSYLHADFTPKDRMEVSTLFERFRDEESKLSGWDPAHLVKPSGSPHQPLHLKLHYPTFRSHHLEYGESADPTNNSTRLLMQKGLNNDNAFWFEACCRRQTPVKSRHQELNTNSWPSQVKQAHSRFSQTLERFDNKVLILFGAPNRKDFNSRYYFAERTIKVTETELITIGIVRNNGKIRFLVVYCPHPEWLVWNWTVWAGRYYDTCINVAAFLAGQAVVPTFFDERAKNVKPVGTQRIALRDADTTRKLEKQNRVRCPIEDLPQSIQLVATENEITREKLQAHYSAGHSIAQFIYDLIQSRLSPKSSWNNGVRMPRNMPRTFSAQQLPTISKTSSPQSAVPVRIIPNITKSKNPIIRRAVIHVGREVHLMCVRCGVPPKSKPIDTRPVFITVSSAKGKYIAHRQAFATPACIPKYRKGQIDQFMVPQDANIPYIRSDNLAKVAIAHNVKAAV